jgi:hypothetical protein
MTETEFITIVPAKGVTGLPKEGYLLGSSPYGDLKVQVQKRGRGRSTKVTLRTYTIPHGAYVTYYVERELTTDTSDIQETVEVTPKAPKKRGRKPGRKPKATTAEAAPKKPEPPKTPKKRGRKPGRKPKAATAEAAPKKRGRKPGRKPKAEDSPKNGTQKPRKVQTPWGAAPVAMGDDPFANVD